MQRIQDEVQAKDDETRRLQEEVQEARRRQEEVANALVNATTTPAHHHLKDMDDDDEHVPNGHSHELDNGDMEHEDPVEGRTTQAEKNERLQTQLRVCNYDGVSINLL